MGTMQLEAMFAAPHIRGTVPTSSSYPREPPSAVWGGGVCVIEAELSFCIFGAEDAGSTAGTALSRASISESSFFSGSSAFSAVRKSF